MSEDLNYDAEIQLMQFRYGSKYQRFLRLLEDMRLIEPGEVHFHTRCGHTVYLVGDEEDNLTLEVEHNGIKSKTKASRTQWNQLVQVEKRIKLSGMQSETGVGDHGGWQIRLTENTIGAEYVEFVFTRDADMFAYVRVAP